jgi:hypothetical protein
VFARVLGSPFNTHRAINGLPDIYSALKRPLIDPWRLIGLQDTFHARLGSIVAGSDRRRAGSGPRGKRLYRALSAGSGLYRARSAGSWLYRARSAGCGI